MVMKRTVIIVLAAAALGACNTGAAQGPAYMPPSRVSSSAYMESDFAWSTGSGGGGIDGVMGYRSGGTRYNCQDVVLAPETPWSRARMHTLYLSTSQATMPVEDVKARTPPEHGAEYARYARHATCDGQGRFSFSSIPNGAWYVITVANPIGGGTRMAVMRRVEIDGDIERVVLH
jgi:hypothetical protein